MPVLSGGVHRTDTDRTRRVRPNSRSLSPGPFGGGRPRAETESRQPRGDNRVNAKRFGVVLTAALVVAAAAALGALSSDGRHGSDHRAAEAQKVVFFASDGMRPSP